MARRNKPTIIANWEPAKIIKGEDNIVSCAQFKHVKPFTVSYEGNNEIYMNWLLAGQYGKIWHEEHQEWEEQYFGKNIPVKENFIKKNIDRIKIMEQKVAERKKAAAKSKMKK